MTQSWGGLLAVSSSPGHFNNTKQLYIPFYWLHAFDCEVSAWAADVYLTGLPIVTSR